MQLINKYSLRIKDPEWALEYKLNQTRNILYCALISTVLRIYMVIWHWAKVNTFT
jgi:hypothetical protein